MGIYTLQSILIFAKRSEAIPFPETEYRDVLYSFCGIYGAVFTDGPGTDPALLR